MITVKAEFKFINMNAEPKFITINAPGEREGREPELAKRRVGVGAEHSEEWLLVDTVGLMGYGTDYV
jgi:hypothetical protein